MPVLRWVFPAVGMKDRLGLDDRLSEGWSDGEGVCSEVSCNKIAR